MIKAPNVLILFCLTAMASSLLKAQVYIGYDVGLVSYTFQTEEFGENYYKATSPEYANIKVIYKRRNSSWNIQFSHQNTTLTPGIDKIDYFETHHVDYVNTDLQIEYLNKVEELSGAIEVFFGGKYTGRISNYERVIKSEFSEQKLGYEEVVFFNLSFLGELQYNLENTLVQYEIGLGVLDYRSKTDPWYDDSDNFWGLGPNLFLDIQSSISLQIAVTEKFSLQPEYLFRYMKYKGYEEVRLLKQSFLVRGVFKL